MNVGHHRVELYDTTLRDGTQREGLSLSVGEKLRIAQRLDAFGVAYIEGGWPGSNPKDAELFARARDLPFGHAKLAAFGATRRAALAVEDDPSVRALLEAKTPVCTLFGKSSPLQVTEVLRTTLEENLRMIEETVAYLVGEGRTVVYDAEHFFDGYAADPAYALETLAAAARGGASRLVLCDTNGGGMPWKVEEVTRIVVARFDIPIGIHAHDDAGCAVANSLAAVRGGARHVQGTINGWGERCGNADLCSIIPTLELKLSLRALPEGALVGLTDLSREVARLADLPPDPHQAYVGRSAFAHKGGVHVAAMRRFNDAYQHVDPEAVGNRMRVVVSELSGRGNVLSQAEALGIDVESDTAVELLEEIKLRESEGYSFDAAEGSVALHIERRRADYRPPFEVLDYKVLLGRQDGAEPYAEATVKTCVEGRVTHTAAAGDGPVEALDRALRKALEPALPQLAHVRLNDFSVRILDGCEGTSSVTRVWIESRAGERTWGTVGASRNVIEASCRALVDGLEYGLRVLERHGVGYEEAS
jgi:2-isopropylmalate synthase